MTSINRSIRLRWNIRIKIGVAKSQRRGVGVGSAHYSDQLQEINFHKNSTYYYHHY